MHLLVTGGAGFLGVALSNRLVRDGHQVYVMDNLTAGDPSRLDPAVLFTRGDVPPTVPRAACRKAGGSQHAHRDDLAEIANVR